MEKLDQKNLNESIAGHVRTDYTTLKMHETVLQAMQWLRSQELSEKIIYFYVVDDDKKLVGVVPVRRLLMSKLEETVASIMIAQVISIPDKMTVLEACEFFVMHQLLAFPVVDSENRILGVVDVSLFTDEMFDVSERQNANDVFQLIGIRVLRGRHSNPFAGFKDRFPWLLCNIAGGLRAFIAGLYDHLLSQEIVLALFIPVVLALSESVSIQSMSITLQGFRQKGTDWRQIFRSLRSEFMTAGLLGSATGILIAIVCRIWKGDNLVALSIGVSVYLSILTSCFMGIILPSVVRAFKGDPKIAAGPMVLACSDVATLLFYFNMSLYMLHNRIH